MATLTLFIHGIGSSSNTWADFVGVMNSDQDTSTIQEFEPNITNISEGGAYYALYDYRTNIIGPGKYVNRFIEALSGTKVNGNVAIKSHVKTLESFIKLNSKYFHRVNIVAHSLGGVVAMKLLLTKNDEISKKLESILLYGVPLKGSEEPKELKKILGKKIPTSILQELIPTSVTITSLTQEIERNKDYLKNTFRILYIKGDADSRIVEVDDSYVTKFGQIESIQGGHSEIITPNNISEQSFLYFKEFIFERTREEEKKMKEKAEAEEKINQLVFKPAFSEFLENVDILSHAHPDKKMVKLADIYIYPRLEKYNEFNKSKQSKNAKKLIDEVDSIKLLIAGESQSGKTSLCKSYIVTLKEKGFVPVYLSDAKNLYEGRIDKRIKNAFKDQYEGCSIEELPKEKIIPILDNFHVAKKKERHLSDLKKYPNSILVVDDLFSLNISQDNLLINYDHYRIKEYSPTLRNETIKRWLELSEGNLPQNEKYSILDSRFEQVENALGKVIGNGIMPAYPFFILSIISTFETFEKPLDQEITSQGHCYQALIYLFLKKQNVKNDEVDTYINFLTEFAFFFFEKSKKELSKQEFDVFFKKYQEQYNLPIKEDVLLKKLSNIQIIALDSLNNYRFAYPYLYYFFVAKYLVENNDKNSERYIDDLIENLHKNENAYILTFISHHSKDDSFLDKIENCATNLFSTSSPSTLDSKELSFFNDKANELLKAVLPNGDSSPEKERAKKLKAQDEIEEENGFDHELDKEIENHEDYLNLRKSVKTVEVMGHIIKNRAGSLKKEKLQSIFINAMNVNLRFISQFIELIEDEDNQIEIIEFLKSRLKVYTENNDFIELSREDIDKIVIKLFWNINFFTISTVLNKVVHSLGSDKLIQIVESACDEENTPAAFLVKHGIFMWYQKNLQLEKIVDRVEKEDFSPISKRILDFMIVNHCSLHSIKTKDLQRIEDTLRIKTGKLNTPFKLIKK